MGRFEGGLRAAEMPPWMDRARAEARPVSTEQRKPAMNETIRLLKRRRSVKPHEMSGPGPNLDQIETLLTIAARVPDHGKLTPWRFIVFQGAARERAGRIGLEIKLADNPALDEVSRAAELTRFSRSRRW